MLCDIDGRQMKLRRFEANQKDQVFPKNDRQTKSLGSLVMIF
jgi:hypothetical protein